MHKVDRRLNGGPAHHARSGALSLAFGGFLLLGTVGAATAFEFPVFPNWESTPQSHVATGCALRDLDGDGWPDLIVANGNDIYRQPLVVYRNQGGTFPLTPTWTSTDIDYHGHLDLADVDGDGHVDCAVGVYLGPAGFSERGYAKLYRGNGDGTFSSTPVWSSQDDFHCFSVSFGDVDMDGRPDLACTAGESYTGVRERFRVYRNEDGALGDLPYWQSAETRYALDCTWGDIDGDGHLDLAFANESNPSYDPVTFPKEVYFGNGTTLAATPGWLSADGNNFTNTIALGDLNGDGWLDLAVADNNQLTGGNQNGRTKLYLNDGAGQLHAMPDWTSSFNGYGSHVSFVDVDADGDLDLAAGSWWGAVRLYANEGGALPLDPTWQSSTSSVIENIAWEDVDGDALQDGLREAFPGDGTRAHFVLARRPVRIREVLLDGAPLDPASWFASAEQGWLTVGPAPAHGSLLEVVYAASSDLDFAVSNWDSGKGNYLFLNGLDTTGIDGDLAAGTGLRVLPNPASGPMRLLLESPVRGAWEAWIVDVRGARVRTLRGGPGVADLVWDGRDAGGRDAAAGTYWVRLIGEDVSASRRVVLLR